MTVRTNRRWCVHLSAYSKARRPSKHILYISHCTHV
jgi:hypothetical protein